MRMKLLVSVLAMPCAAALGTPIAFDMVEINPAAGVVPAVALSDLDGDKDLDLVVMSNDDIAWHENPGWERHVIAATIDNLNVCMALADITGDGLPELAAGADWQFGNTKSGGTLHILVRGADVKQPWLRKQILSEPTIHRIRWADTDSDNRPELFVAPLKGRNTTEPEFKEAGVRLLRLAPPADPLAGEWPVEVVSENYHIMHNLIPYQGNGAGRPGIITASFEGLSLLRRDGNGQWSARLLTAGSPLPWPQSGSSEVKVGAYGLGYSPCIATIEPWHGNEVVVYMPSAFVESRPVGDKNWLFYTLDDVKQWRRQVVDDTFNQGHAIGWADFDGDSIPELAAGYREPSPATQKVGLNVYRFSEYTPGEDMKCEKILVDDGGIAVEDLAIGDLDGDGDADVLASGRSTHNVRIYLNQAARPQTR